MQTVTRNFHRTEMEELFIIFFLIILLFPIGLGLLIFYLIKKYGKKNYAYIFALIYTSIIIFVSINIIFEDELFSKNDAIKLLNEQEFILEDDFKIIENKSMSAIGDYYHTFTLEITEEDKNRLIKEISESKDYKKLGDKTIIDLYYTGDKYNGIKATQNFENQTEYIREYFKPNGKGYAPTYRKIKVQKESNHIIFEEFDD